MIQNISTNTNGASKNISVNSGSASLQQNSPNPFSQNTIIKCFIPSSAKQAQLIVYNIDGHQLKSYTLSNGNNSVIINASIFSSGQYSYSLLIDGNKVDSKSMLLTK
ncbi:MAG: T9SS type A sorting domain-containing protein [Chitinophagaceae bacterium]